MRHLRLVSIFIIMLLPAMAFAVDFSVLKDEVTTDPLVRGYLSMTDDQVAADLNTKYRYRIKEAMSASAIFQNINIAEYTALAQSDKDMVWNILHMGNIKPNGIEAALLIAIFGNSSTTIANLAEARKQFISRAAELGLPRIKVGWIQQVRQ